VLDDAQLDEFQRRGIVRVPSLVPADLTDHMQDAVWRFLSERDGVDRDDRATWPVGGVHKLQMLRAGGLFDDFMGHELAGLVDQLLGPGRWHRGVEAPGVQPLITFPAPGTWELPHKTWHVDLPARGPADRLTALRMLGLVSPVEPRGGGTLVVEGSHELVRRMVEERPEHDAGRSADVRRRLLRSHRWFCELAQPGAGRIERFMGASVDIDGVPVRVAEVTGGPGDVHLMHPWLLHNLSPNVRGQPRMMVTHTTYARDQPFFSEPALH
jgi:hypothetical protein